MIEFHGFEYELDGRSHIVPEPDRNLKTKTVQVEIKETVKRLIEVELPIDMKDEAAEDIVSLMYDQSCIIIDGDDIVCDVDVELV